MLLCAGYGTRLGPLSDDAFLCGRLRLWQPVTGCRAATDPVLLAAACPAVAGQTVLDLGCGAGAAALCLAARVPGVVLAGLEVQPGYAVLARANAARNAVTMEVHEGDVAAEPAALRRGFDHVICNPPYYATGGTPAADDGTIPPMPAVAGRVRSAPARTRRARPAQAGDANPNPHRR